MNERYARQIMLPEIGKEGQQRLLNSRVLIVGVGGLGSPTALYLTAAGVGHIGIIDSDVVSESNLQRQVLYTTNEVGEKKVEKAYNRLKELSPHTYIEQHDTRLTESNAAAIISQYDIVIDGCDNAATRYIIDEACARQGKPYIYGAISEYEGQVSVFDAREGWRYTHLYPDKEFALSLPQKERGVIGTLPGIVGTVQATEAIKLITGWGDALVKKIFTIDLHTMESHVVKL